jgi:hypothetical protein
VNPRFGAEPKLNIELVQKFAYCEIYQPRSLVERSVVARRHNDELPIWQTSEYFGIFFDGGEVVVASHDEYGY